VIVHGRRELWAQAGAEYKAFVDPSGGRIDSMTCAIAHSDPDGRLVLDLAREWRPPFSPERAVESCVSLLHPFGIHEVVGDRYGGQWVPERFAMHGVRYAPSALSKSECYSALVSTVNSGRCELLDDP